jgi:hypothetical protein
MMTIIRPRIFMTPNTEFDFPVQIIFQNNHDDVWAYRKCRNLRTGSEFRFGREPLRGNS